jgi:alpha-glucan,water dikinase
LEQALKNKLGSSEHPFTRTFDVPEFGRLVIAVAEKEDRYEVFGISDIAGPLVLHWGIAQRSPHEWLEPPESWRLPAATRRDGNSAETPFVSLDGSRQLELSIPKTNAPLGVQFVLKQGTEGRWLKHQGGNFSIPIRASSQSVAGADAGELGEMVKRITQSETGSGSWTLMHRFNLCFDLLDQREVTTRHSRSCMSGFAFQRSAN